MAPTLHILSVTLYLGFLVGLWCFEGPAVSATSSQGDRVRLLIRSFKIYNPLQIGVLGVLVLTGAFQVTDLKESYGVSFAAHYGTLLGTKLLLSFLIIMVGTYQCLGIGHRFVRGHEAGQETSPQGLQTVMKRLQYASLLNVLLLTATIYLGIRMAS